MLHECQRLLENRTPGSLEAAPVVLNTVEFALAPSATHTAVGAARSNAATKDGPEAALETGDGGADTPTGSAAGHAAEEAPGTPDGAEQEDGGSANPCSDDNEGEPCREAALADHADAEPESDDQHTEDIDDDEAAPEEFVPTAVHATTTAVDDWLHRGPFLEPLPLFVYMQHVQRVPKSQRVLTGGGMHFAFDAR